LLTKVAVEAIFSPTRRMGKPCLHPIVLTPSALEDEGALPQERLWAVGMLPETDVRAATALRKRRLCGSVMA